MRGHYWHKMLAVNLFSNMFSSLLARTCLDFESPILTDLFGQVADEIVAVSAKHLEGQGTMVVLHRGGIIVQKLHVRVQANQVSKLSMKSVDR